MLVNIKTVKKCAFCKYWYDPTNSAINPKSPAIGQWEIIPNIKNKCLKTNLNMASTAFCSRYECKM